MADLNINKIELNNMLKELQQDNDSIIKNINLINSTLEKLDESIWKSSEKEKIDKELFPYVKKELMIIETNLNNCSNSLNLALQTYLETENDIISEASKLNGFDVERE